MGNLLVVACGTGLLLWTLPRLPRWLRWVGLAVFSVTSLYFAFVLVYVWIQFLS
jgi:hypothetical protein